MLGEIVRRVLCEEGPVCEASSGEAPDPESSPYKTLHTRECQHFQELMTVAHLLGNGPGCLFLRGRLFLKPPASIS